MIPTQDDIRAAYARIKSHVRRTPALRIDTTDFGVKLSHPLGLKLEFLQHTGSFKPRGAFNNLLSRNVPVAGIAAASGGNHGAAAAYAAMRLGHKATIFVPDVSSPVKIARIKSYGADTRVGGARYADALEQCEKFIAESGALSVHAYDAPETVTGQGTVGLEWEEDAPELDTVLVAVGGGGLIGGIAAWFAGKVKVIAVEPEGAPTLNLALKAGEPVDSPAEGIAADSLAPKQVGKLMFPIAQRHVHASVLVTDDAIRAAQKALWDNVRVVSEPGGAAALAALISGAYKPAADERVAVLVCGANTTAVSF
jgi:threonine dehydratase